MTFTQILLCLGLEMTMTRLVERQTLPSRENAPLALPESEQCGRVLRRIKRAFCGLRAGAWLGFAGLALLFIGLRWNSYDVPLIRDEGEYAYAAQLLQHGLLPYQHSFLQKPPMVAYSYALACTLAPHTFWAPRILAYVFVAMATCLLGLIARNEFGPGIALPAMCLVTPMLLLPGLEQFTANTEMFMLLPLLGTVAVYSFSRNRSDEWWPWCLAGFLGSVTLCYKYTALPLLAWLYGAWSFQQFRLSRNVRLLAWNWLWALVGALAGGAVVLGPFLAAGAGPQLWDCTVRFNRFYAKSESFGLGALWSSLQLFGSNWWIVFLLPLALVWFRPRRIGFWVGLFAAAWVMSGLSWYGHYYIVIMPFWAVLSAAAIAHCSSWAAARLRCQPGLVRMGLAGAVLVLVCLPDIPWMVMTHGEFAFNKLDETNPFLESRAVAERIAAASSPDDYVFVAGSEPQILCYAKRFSPSRFINAYPLMLPTPLARSYQQEAIGELERHPPALIVLSRRPSSWLRAQATPPDFLDYMQKLLAEKYRVLGGYVLQLRGGRWEEPLSDFHAASLVVYERRINDGNRK